MSSPFRALAPIALSFALVVGACSDRNNDNSMAQDSSLSRDLALANADSSASPQLSDVPANPPESAQPAASQPAPKPAAPKPRPTTTRPRSTPTTTTTPSGNTAKTSAAGSEAALASVPAGSEISMTSNDRVCTNTNKAGDRFTATVTNSVTGTNGAVIPAGAKAVIQIADLKRSENATDNIQMVFNVLSLSWNGKTYPVNAAIEHVDVDKVRNSSTGNDAKKVVGGAVVGAILGQVIGKNTKSTVIGAATGAAAGTAVAMGTANYEGCVPNGGNIQVKLNEPATIQ
ncbi:MAG TPA: glycine zipper 2TM domain-containing protein [Gemmatimonadaceae bacterium]|nr:glycine zipper 2TM domain-containing protein [Gemmatimonadaceae bacterium]